MDKLSHGKRVSSSDVAYNKLKQKIIELEYEPELQLIEEQLSAELEVSRTPLRQALYRLTLEGLLIKKPNGRIYVAPITLKEVEEVYKVREVMEGLLAKEATINMTDEKFQELDDLINLMKLSTGQNRNELTVKYGRKFHTVLYSLSTNQTAKRFIEQLNAQIERYRTISSNKNPAFINTVPVQEHREILNLIHEGNPEKVEIEMRKHIKRSLEIAKQTLELDM
jgi:DNA-binding GntR family transcriptional regulator